MAGSIMPMVAATMKPVTLQRSHSPMTSHR